MERELLKAKPVVRRLKYLMEQYVKDLSRSDQEEYSGSYWIFEYDEPLYRALFETEYANTHLDYEFFNSTLHYMIVGHKLRDPEEIFNGLLKYIQDTTHTRDWASIFPLRFNRFLSRGPSIKGILHIGRFKLVEARGGHSELKTFLKEEFGFEKLCDESYSYMAFEKYSDGALRNDAFLAFEVYGSEESRNYSSIQKFNYFCRVFEIFSVLSGSPYFIAPSSTKNIHHAFFVNRNAGTIDYHPLTQPSRLEFQYSERFRDFSKENDFEFFSNRIFYAADKVFARIRSAMYFFSKGLNGRDHVMSFLSYIIAIESLFSSSDKGKIKETLACYISKLCYMKNEQDKYSNIVKDLYKQRSDIVHYGKFDLRGEALEQARDIAATAILECFKLHRDLLMEEERANLETRFFKHLKSLSQVETEAG